MPDQALAAPNPGQQRGRVAGLGERVRIGETDRGEQTADTDGVPILDAVPAIDDLFTLKVRRRDPHPFRFDELVVNIVGQACCVTSGQ